jgi:hypothetical protein
MHFRVYCTFFLCFGCLLMRFLLHHHFLTLKVMTVTLYAGNVAETFLPFCTLNVMFFGTTTFCLSSVLYAAGAGPVIIIPCAGELAVKSVVNVPLIGAALGFETCSVLSVLNYACVCERRATFRIAVLPPAPLLATK